MNISSLAPTELSQQVAISVNAVLTNPNLSEAMDKIGFTSEKVKAGLHLQQEVINWQERQEETQANSQRVQRNLRQLHDTIDSMYVKHRFAAHYIYRENEAKCQQLNLHRSRSSRFKLWLEEVQRFYHHLDDKVSAHFENLNEEAIEVKKLLVRLHEFQKILHESRTQDKHITEVKRAAVLKLSQWFSYFISSAEHACKDNPQLLEEMRTEVNTKQ